MADRVKNTQRTRARKRRILLVDDHRILRESFGELINLERDLQVCGQATGVTGALVKVRKGMPDLVVVDIELRGTSGIDLIKRLKGLYPELPVLALSVHDEVLYAERALRAGARGYVIKQAPLEEMMLAVRRVLNGEGYVSVRMHRRVTVSRRREKMKTGT